MFEQAAGLRWHIPCLVLVALLASACAEEEEPDPQPQFTVSSTSIQCGIDADDREILEGGDVVVIDNNLVSVELFVDGLAPVSLSTTFNPETVGEDVDADEAPQTWTFETSFEPPVLCHEDLILTFVATDEEGQITSIAARAK